MNRGRFIPSFLESLMTLSLPDTSDANTRACVGVCWRARSLSFTALTFTPIEDHFGVPQQ